MQFVGPTLSICAICLGGLRTTCGCFSTERLDELICGSCGFSLLLISETGVESGIRDACAAG